MKLFILALLGYTAEGLRSKVYHNHKINSYSLKHKFNNAKHQNRMKDAYDNDPNTVSQYDDIKQHKKFDYGVEEGEPGHSNPWSLIQKNIRD